MFLVVLLTVDRNTRKGVARTGASIRSAINATQDAYAPPRNRLPSEKMQQCSISVKFSPFASIHASLQTRITGVRYMPDFTSDSLPKGPRRHIS